MHNDTYKVLLVEDSRTDYYMLEHFLSSYHSCKFDIEWIDNYKDGLENVLSKNYDFCLIDYRLGHDSGVELAKLAHEQGCQSPIVICSGEDKGKIEGLSDASNIVGFISKMGLSTDTIITELRALIGDGGYKGVENAPGYLVDEENPVVAFNRQGRVVLVNDAFKSYDFMASTSVMGVKASDLFSAPILDDLDYKTACKDRVFTTRVYIARGEHHRMLWRFMPVSIQESPEIHYVAKGILQKKKRKRKHRKKGFLMPLLTKLYKDPSYVKINDTYYDRDMFL
jgi:CheY-like chemotaxis protein|tara:strand:- start:1744 stop:2589 length:846 start_codon:yes stop_codon:yes gene_type:complete